jgi:hypothetical protein
MTVTLPETIQAITFSKTGGVEVLEKTTLPFPQQKPSDIIVKVREPKASNLTMMPNSIPRSFTEA